MKTKLTRVDGKIAVFLDESVLEEAHIGEDDAVEVSAVRNVITVTAAERVSDRKVTDRFPGLYDPRKPD